MTGIGDLIVTALKDAVPGLVKAAEHAAAGALGLGAQKKSCVQAALSSMLTCATGFGANVDPGTALTALGDHVDQVVAGFNTDGTFKAPAAPAAPPEHGAS